MNVQELGVSAQEFEWPVTIELNSGLRDSSGEATDGTVLTSRIRTLAKALQDLEPAEEPVLAGIGNDVPSVVLLLAATLARLTPVALDRGAVSPLQLEAALRTTHATNCLVATPGGPLPSHCARAGIATTVLSASERYAQAPEQEIFGDRFILTTSGTSGEPKAAVLSLRKMRGLLAGLAERLPLHREDVVYNPLPIAHSYGLSNLLHGLASGATVQLRPRLLFADELAADLRHTGATVFAGVPAHFDMLASLDTEALRSALSSVRAMWCAGDAMPAATTRRLRQALPDVELYLMYGQTEASSRISILAPDRVDEKPLSSGSPLPGVSLTIVDEHLRPVPLGVTGQVTVEAPYLMRGYWPLTPDGDTSVIYTGDLGYLDADGDLFVVGRSSSFAKILGERIPLQVLDSIIAELPHVANAVVQLNRHGSDGTDRLRAVVVATDDGACRSSDEVKAHVWSRTRKVRLDDVVFAETLPTTASGKLVRFFRH